MLPASSSLGNNRSLLKILIQAINQLEIGPRNPDIIGVIQLLALHALFIHESTVGAAKVFNVEMPLPEEEVRMAMWPDFFLGPSRSEGQVTLHLEGGPALETRVSHLVVGKAKWGFGGEPVLAGWLEGLRAAPGDDLIVRPVEPHDLLARVDAKGLGDLSDAVGEALIFLEDLPLGEAVAALGVPRLGLVLREPFGPEARDRIREDVLERADDR